ncbi:MAG: hypothetical protein QW794_03405, partial [Thermosphaera sp.]
LRYLNLKCASGSLGGGFTMYTSRILMYMRAITPVHVGVGRGYGVYVNLLEQRDEFGFPST